MKDDQDINKAWVSVSGMTVIVPDNIAAVAIEVLFGVGVVPMPVAPSDMAVHPTEFLDEDGRHDYELIYTVPVNLPDLWEDERIAWAQDVCKRARTAQLRDLEPWRLVRKLLGEDE